MAPEPLSDPSAEEFFQSLIIAAQYVPGDSKIFEEGQEVSWLDMDLPQSGQRFFQKHYASILFAHSMYFGLGFGFKPVTGVVINTNGFKGLERTTRRLLSTIWHVLRWYEEDIVGRYAPGFKAISNIRTTHAAMRKKCGRPQKDFDFGEEDEILPEKPDAILDALVTDL